MLNGMFVGLSTIDIVYRVDRFPAANEKVEAHCQDVFAGGPATNAAIAFGHLGGSATLVTVVGRHVLTSVVRAELARYAVRLIDLDPDFDEIPVISSIAVNSSGERDIVSANASRVRAFRANVDERSLADAAVVLVDGHYLAACRAWAKAARARRTPVVLDGGSWKPGTDELLDHVDTAICSADFFPPGCSTEDQVLEYLKDRGVANVALTQGAQAIRFVSADGSSGFVDVAPVGVVDTMGAGDIFHGAFCYYASTGREFTSALAQAAQVAAHSARFAGTREWMSHSVSQPAAKA